MLTSAGKGTVRPDGCAQITGSKDRADSDAPPLWPQGPVVTHPSPSSQQPGGPWEEAGEGGVWLEERLTEALADALPLDRRRAWLVQMMAVSKGLAPEQEVNDISRIWQKIFYKPELFLSTPTAFSMRRPLIH